MLWSKVDVFFVTQSTFLFVARCLSVPSAKDRKYKIPISRNMCTVENLIIDSASYKVA